MPSYSWTVFCALGQSTRGYLCFKEDRSPLTQGCTFQTPSQTLLCWILPQPQKMLHSVFSISLGETKVTELTHLFPNYVSVNAELRTDPKSLTQNPKLAVLLQPERTLSLQASKSLRGARPRGRWHALWTEHER